MPAIRLLGLTLGLSLIPLSHGAGAEEPAGSSSLAAQEHYRADFAESGSRGIGVRFHHVPSRRFVDLRLRGFPGREPTSRGRAREFAADTGIKVIYEPQADRVKETIILSRREPTEFRFTLNAPGLRARVEGGHVLLDAPEQPALFRLRPVVAWDAAGTRIPASLSLDGSEVRVSLDREAVTTANLPITIDPTITGAPSGSTGAPHARRLFQTSDGRLVFFYKKDLGSGSNDVVYQVSSDQGQTWGAQQSVGVNTIVGEIAGTEVSGSDDFILAYTAAVGSSPWIGARVLTSQPNGSWLVGPERRAPIGGYPFVGYLSVVEFGSGPLGRKIALGFMRSDGTLGLSDYVGTFSENSGQSWSLPAACGSWYGILAVQGNAISCITGDFGAESLQSKPWLGTAWGSPTPVPLGGTFRGTLPSTLTTDDGALHMVVETATWDDYVAERGEVRHTSRPAGVDVWPAVERLGRGQGPVIAAIGPSLHVYAQDRKGDYEIWIRQYVAPDGTTWAPAVPWSGLPFMYVLDFNGGWAFEDRTSDALFAVIDPQGAVGNMIGTVSIPHRLDAPDKRLSFSFQSTTSGAVNSLQLWVMAQSSPVYRVGLQTDAGGQPSGTWVANGLAPAYGEVAFTDANSPAPTVIPIPSATLNAGSSYHLVVEWANTLGNTVPGPTSWAGPEAVGADDAGLGTLRVLDQAAGTWAVAPSQAPRFILSSDAGTLLSQAIGPRPPEPIHEYAVPGESFVLQRSVTPVAIKLFLTKAGNPTGPATLRLLDASGSELWSGDGTPSTEGWLSLPVSGVTLAPGTRYRVVIDAHATDLTNYWQLAVSGDSLSSWDGTSSTLTVAADRAGFNERTTEANDDRAVPVDFAAFNSGTQDALYLGGLDPFAFVSLTRLSADAGASVSTQWSYWNGSSWAPLTLSRNTLGMGYPGEAEFSPPIDWARTEVDGRDAYWVRVVSTTTPPPAIYVERISGIGHSWSPTVAPRARDYVPLAWESEVAGIRTIQDTPAPTRPDLFLDRSQHLNAQRKVTQFGDWIAVQGMSVSMPMRQGSTHFVRGIISAQTVTLSNPTTPVSSAKVLQGTRVDCSRSDQVQPLISFNEPSGVNKTTQNNLGGLLVLESFFLFEGTVTTTVTCQMYVLAEEVANPPVGHTIEMLETFIWISGPPQPDAREDSIEGTTLEPGESPQIAFINNWTPTRPRQEIRVGVELTNCTSTSGACSSTISSTADAFVVLTLSVVSPTCDITRGAGTGSTVRITPDTHHLKLIREVTATELALCTSPTTVTVSLRVGTSSNPVAIEPGNKDPSNRTGWGTLVARSCTLLESFGAIVMCSGT